MPTKNNKLSRAAAVARVMTFSLLMAALIAAELYLHYTTIPTFLEYLKEAGHTRSAWIGEQLSYALPFLTVAFFQYLVYRHAERNSMAPGTVCPAVRSLQREKAFEILGVALLLYAVILPYCIHLSNETYATALAEALKDGTTLPQTDGKVDDKMIYHLAEWFIRQGIPLALLGTYHVARAGEDEDEADEPEVVTA